MALQASINIHGPLTARTNSVGTNHWVHIENGDAGYGDLTIYVENAASAQAIADAINAAFQTTEAEPHTAIMETAQQIGTA